MKHHSVQQLLFCVIITVYEILDANSSLPTRRFCQLETPDFSQQRNNWEDIHRDFRGFKEDFCLIKIEKPLMYVHTQIKLEFSLPFVCERPRFCRGGYLWHSWSEFLLQFQLYQTANLWLDCTERKAKISFYILDEYSRWSWKLCDRVACCVCCWLQLLSFHFISLVNPIENTPESGVA